MMHKIKYYKPALRPKIYGLMLVRMDTSRQNSGQGLIASIRSWPLCRLWVTCGRRPGKNFLTFCSIGRVRSRVRPVDAAGWPLALMLCADQVPNKLTHFGIGALTQAGSPDPRNNRICITSSCPRQLVLMLPLRWPASRRQQQFRLLVSLGPDHDGPGHPRNLVGERDGRHLGRTTFP